MNEYLVTILAVLVSLGIGFALLINFGVSEVTYFVLVIFILTILGSIFYTWWKTKTDKPIERLKVEILVRIIKDHADTHKLMLKVEELMNMDSILKDLELIKNNLITLEFYDRDFKKVSKSVEKYTLTFIEQESRKTEQRLRSLEALAAGSYKPKLGGYIRELELKIDKLNSAGYQIGEKISEFKVISNQPAKSLREMIDKKSRISRHFVSILDDCIEEAARLSASSAKYGDVVDVKHIEQTILDIRNKKDDFDYAIFQLVNVRNKLKDQISDVFIIKHNTLLTSIKNVLDILEDHHVDMRYRESVNRLFKKLTPIKDPGLINVIIDMETQFKNSLAHIIAQLNSRVIALERDINLGESYKKIWSSDDRIPSLVKKMDVTEDLEQFSKNAVRALKRIVAQLGKDMAFTKIVENYDKVEPIITGKLKENATLSSSDLNVKYADKFMLLYSLKHMEAEFKNNELKWKKRTE